MRRISHYHNIFPVNRGRILHINNILPINNRNIKSPISPPISFPLRPRNELIYVETFQFRLPLYRDGTFSYRFAVAKQKKRTSLPALIVYFSHTLTLGYN